MQEYDQVQTKQEHCQPLSLKALSLKATQKVYSNISWDGTVQQTRLPASQSNNPFQSWFWKSNLISSETAPAITFLHRRPLPCKATTSPSPATTFLQQRSPSCTSNYQFCTSDHLSNDYQSCTSYPVLHQRLDPAPVTTIGQRWLFTVHYSDLRFTIIKFDLLKQHPCFVILA